MSFTPGQFIYHNKYEILALIGEGSFARVWKAREPGFADRLVAIKELKREELTPEEVRKAELRFGLETQIARAMREHNVPSVVLTNTVEVLPESGEKLLVMDFMPGGSLEGRIRRQPEGMPLLEALNITLTICAALASFHALPIMRPVHRDIKPSNILFDAGGRARLADFGVAQVQGYTIVGSRTLGTAENQPGTLEYMSPEQANSRDYVRPAADVFALGCVLFEMLTGQLYKRQRTGTPPSAFRPELPKRLDALLAGALAENPDDRFQSAEALAGALQSVHDEMVAEQKRREQISDLHRRAEDALTGKDFAAARQAVVAWLALSPGDSRALGLRARIDTAEREAALASEIAGYRATFETALNNENWSAARAALANWERVAPGDPELAAAGKRLTQAEADAKLRARIAEVQRKARAAIDAGKREPALSAAREWQRLEPHNPAMQETLMAAEALPRGTGKSRAWLLGVTGAVLALIVFAWGLYAVTGGGTDEETPAPTKLAASSSSDATATPEPLVALDATKTLDPAVPPTSAVVGDTWERPADGMTMVFVPAGSFLMGSDSGDSEADDDEFPQHEVTLDGFWIDRTEVTGVQFGQFVSETGHVTTAETEGWSYVFTGSNWEETDGADWQHPAGPGSDLSGLAQHPVLHISWYDADAYCEWAGARLPTEAEWEYAARGPEGNRFPWGDDFDGDIVNFCDANCEFDWAYAAYDDGWAQTAPVGSYLAGASWVGVLDMAGNVWEWVQDWYDSYDSSPAENPAGPTSGDFKVLRGGSWFNRSRHVRSAYRLTDQPGIRHVIIGFRCASPQAVGS